MISLKLSLMLGYCFEKKFDGGCRSDAGALVTSITGALLKHKYQGLSLEACYQKCTEYSRCREFKTGKVGGGYEGECMLYTGGCIQETRWGLATTVAMYNMSCSRGKYRIFSNVSLK